MKKSTILFLIVVYIASFFIVGLIGISIRAHYSVDYVTEILIEKMDNQPTLTLKEGEEGYRREEIVNPDDPEHARYNNYYGYDVDYVKDLVLQFKITVKPDSSTYSSFTVTPKTSENIGKVVVNEDSTIYVYVYKRKNISFDVVSNDGNNVTASVEIDAW